MELRVLFLEESYKSNVDSKGTIICGKLYYEWFPVKNSCGQK
jgi:hypothetical protein